MSRPISSKCWANGSNERHVDAAALPLERREAVAQQMKVVEERCLLADGHEAVAA